MNQPHSCPSFVDQASDTGVSPTPIHLESLRRPVVIRVMVFMTSIWLLYTVSGFRFPTSPIVISDANAGSAIRQVVFAGSGMAALGFLFLYRGIGSIVALRLPFFGLIALMLISILWSDAPSLTIKRTAIFIFGLLTVLTLVHASSRPTQLMVRVLVYSSGVFALASLFFHIVLPSNCTVNPARPGLAGIAVHPNTLGPFLSIGLLLSLGMCRICKKACERVLVRFFQILMAVALVLTFSMTTLVTTFVGIGFYLVLSSNHYRLGVIQISTLIAVVLIALIGVGTLKSMFFDATGRDESLSGRDELWKAVQIEVAKNPIMGSGYGAFWTEGKGREITQTWNPRQSHHAYLDVLLDLGVIGLGVVLLLFPLKLIASWSVVCGAPGTAKRNILASLYAAVFCYLCFYSFSQSYFLKFDSYPFLVLVWTTLLVSNRDSNNLENEFPSDDR